MNCEFKRIKINHYHISGDTLVWAPSENKQFVTNMDFALKLNYPGAGSGAHLTFALIKCHQSTAPGKAYIASGGLDSREIQIVVEANSTKYFNYSALIYGIK